MIKSLFFALFLSQALMSGAHAGYEQPTTMEYFSVVPRRVHTIRIYAVSDNTVVVFDPFTTAPPPVPYIDYWKCSWGQTAQQCIAIMSMLEAELGAVDDSPVAQELKALKKRIEEKVLQRNNLLP